MFQNMSARLGLATRQHMAEVLGKRWPSPARIGIWLLLEVAVLAADVQETVGRCGDVPASCTAAVLPA
jgi:manganese transport protein